MIKTSGINVNVSALISYQAGSSLLLFYYSPISPVKGGKCFTTNTTILLDMMRTLYVISNYDVS